MSDSIIERLRHHAQDERNTAFARSTMQKGADEIERLRAVLSKANEQTEHFEREWYLRGDELEQLRAELAASREREARMQLQPIDTAPRDGTWVLLGYFPSYMEGVQQGGIPEIAYWSSGAWANNCGKALATAGPFSPTHWMPLPAPPIAALAEGAQG
ncbi:MAG TPA: DUF551 domain-containing protein [Gallionella sp.]|nr:DUF551 domain-containing protein [Gallionella sp.]